MSAAATGPPPMQSAANITGMPKARFEPAAGEATLCGVYVETNDATGLATKVSMIRIGGRLHQAQP